KGEVFFGQSRRFSDKSNPFPVGSGLSDQESDYVGQITLGSPVFNIDYRFQLENDNFSSQRHDVESVFHWDRLTLGTRYFYARGIEGTDLSEAREQIAQSARFRFYDDWYLTGSAWYDMGQNRGLRQASYGIDYI